VTLNLTLDPARLARDAVDLGEALPSRAGVHTRLGWQSALRRPVVVELADARDDPALSTRLWNEGRLLASLEHPGIVPVHAAIELDGVPALVVGRVDGRCWSDVLTHELAAGAPDPLVRHLRVLVAVAQAIAFAHRRGVAHGRLSLERVRLGEYGEVTVHDWHDARVDEASRTDDVRRLADLFREVLGRVEGRAGERLAVDDAPAHLATAERLRDEVAGYLVRREAEGLLVAARQRVDALAEAVSRETSGDAVLVFRLLGQAHVALRQANDAGAPIDEVRIEERRVRLEVTRFGLATGRLELAAAQLAQLGASAPPELVARLEALSAEASNRAARVARLESLAADMSFVEGSRFRRVLGAVFGGAFIVTNLTMGAAERWGGARFDYGAVLVVGLVLLGVLVPLGVALRRSAFRNRANSSFFFVCIALFVLIEACWMGGVALGVPFRSMLAISSVAYALNFGALATLVSPRLWPSAVSGLAAALGCAAAPAFAFEWIGLGVGAGVVWLGFAPPEERKPRSGGE
jgi:hypothetical protein